MKRSHQMLVATGGLLAVAALFGEAVAQTANGATGANVGASKQVKVTPATMKTEGKKIVGRVNKAAKGTRRMLAQARSKNDAVKIVCLDEKLSELNKTASKATKRNKSMNQALRTGQNSVAKHDFTMLQVYDGDGKRLANESKGCIGAEVGSTGNSDRSSSKPNNLPPNNNGGTGGSGNGSGAGGGGLIVPPPNCKSCVN